MKGFMAVFCSKNQHLRFATWIVFFVTLTGSIPAFVYGAHYKVFLLGGQSNGLGRSPSSGLPTSPVDLTQPQTNILFYYDSLASPSDYDGYTPALTTLRPGSGKFTNEFGAEVSFGNAVADLMPGDNIAIIKFATGGTALYDDWSPTGGLQYATFNTTVSNGLAAIEAAGPHTTEIVGMLWHQGENDAIENQQANYQSNLTAFVADVRSRYGADLPFMIGEIHRSNGAAFDTVADAQIAVAAAETNATFVPATDLTLLDQYHFDAPSIVTLGERFASRYIGLLAAPTLDSINDNWDGGPVSTAATVTYTLIFSEDMDASTVTAADFEIVGTVTGATVAEPVETYPGVFTLSVTPGSTGSMQLRVKQDAELLAADSGALVTTSPIEDDTTIEVTPAGSTIYADNVESAGTPWTIVKTKGGDVYWGTKSGLIATAGSEYLYHERLTESNSDIFDAQLGGLQVAEGTYIVTFDIAESTSGIGADLFGLTAGFVTGDGTTRYLDVLDANVSLNNNEPTHDGTFNTWTLTYTVAAGASVIGEPLGFFAELQVVNGGFIAFDNFAVDFTPAGGAVPSISLSDGSIDENLPAGTLVGSLSMANTNGTFSYALVEPGSFPDNASFTLGGAGNSNLLTDAVFDYETKSSYSIRVLATETAPGSLLVTNTLTITVNDQVETTVTVDPTVRHQTMVGFGGALSWYTAWLYGGTAESIAAAEQLMFEDLGLDVVRLKNWYYPVNYPTNTSPTNVTDQTSYDAKQSLYTAAKSYNPEIQVLLSSWSPPAILKSNGDRRNGGTLSSDVDGFQYDELAQYWVDCLDNLGWTPDYLSFQNEPGWTATWESCIFSATETASYAGYAEAIDTIWSAISNRTTVPKLLGSEAENMPAFNNLNAPLLSRSFVDVHGYHTYDIGSESAIDSGTTISRLNNIRDNFGDRPNWMTEFSKDTFDWIEAARVIHTTVVEGNASAYIYWKLLWGGTGSNDTMLAMESYGSPAVVRPHFYTIKHYSKHVDQGYARIDVTGAPSDVKVSGYSSPDESSITLVAINKGVSSVDLALSHSLAINSIEGYQSVAGNYYQTMSGLTPGGTIPLPGSSLTTIVLQLQPTPPIIVTTDPLDNSVAFAPSTLTAIFNEAVTSDTGGVTITNITDGGVIGISSTNITGGTNLVITPSAAFENGKEYAVLIDTNAFKSTASDLHFAGYTNTVNWDWNFTNVVPVAPVVTVDGGATQIGVGTATLSGDLTAGDSVTAYICWGENPGLTNNLASTGTWDHVSAAMTLSANGVFSNAVPGLTYGLEYDYAVYATNSVGEDWSSVTNFATLEPPVTLSVAPTSLSENGGTATVTATLAGLSSSDTTVNLAFGGDAVNGTDYNASANNIIISSNTLSAGITLTGIDNALDEADKTVTVDIVSVSGGSTLIGSPSNVVATIIAVQAQSNLLLQADMTTPHSNTEMTPQYIENGLTGPVQMTTASNGVDYANIQSGGDAAGPYWVPVNQITANPGPFHTTTIELTVGASDLSIEAVTLDYQNFNGSGNFNIAQGFDITATLVGSISGNFGSISQPADGSSSGTLTYDFIDRTAFSNETLTLSIIYENGDGTVYSGFSSYSVLGTDTVATNYPPVFLANPIEGDSATEGAAYSATIAGSATDVDDDSLTYAKVSGPDWLSVAGDGSLSGTPGGADVGDNSFTVSVSDGIADPVPATLNITVAPGNLLLKADMTTPHGTTDMTPDYTAIALTGPMTMTTAANGVNYSGIQNGGDAAGAWWAPNLKLSQDVTTEINLTVGDSDLTIEDVTLRYGSFNASGGGISLQNGPTTITIALAGVTSGDLGSDAIDRQAEGTLATGTSSFNFAGATALAGDTLTLTITHSAAESNLGFFGFSSYSILGFVNPPPGTLLIVR